MKKTYYKLILAVLIFTGTAVLSGCVRDKEECKPAPSNNVLLHFAYAGDKDERNTTRDFPEIIPDVNFYLFDSEYRLIDSRVLSKSDLDMFQGVKLTLEAGDYYVACWGRVESGSTVDKGTYMDNSRLLHSNVLPISPVYYAPAQEIDFPLAQKSDCELFRLSVPATGVLDDTIYFESSHRSVTITVVGFEDEYSDENLPPLIKATNIPTGYDFYTLLLGTVKTYDLHTAFTDAAMNTAAVTVYTPCFTIDDSVGIEICSEKTGQAVYTYNLKELLKEKNINLDSDDPINLRFEFLHGEVIVSLPGWTNEEIE